MSLENKLKTAQNACIRVCLGTERKKHIGLNYFEKINWQPDIRTGITCEEIPCYRRDSTGKWLIVENAKIFRSYVKHF